MKLSLMFVLATSARYVFPVLPKVLDQVLTVIKVCWLGITANARTPPEPVLNSTRLQRMRAMRSSREKTSYALGSRLTMMNLDRPTR
jgi:hypothetical protein